MRAGQNHGVVLALCLAGGVGLLFPPHLASTQSYEYVITFDNVAVRGIDIANPPSMAHRDPPGLEGYSTLPKRTDALGGPSRPEKGAGGERTKQTEKTPGQPSRISMRLPGASLPSEPGQGVGNPSFVQEGFLVEAFWAAKIGTREGFFKPAHFHPPDLSTGFEAQHLGNPDELHGVYIRSLDGKNFDLKRLRYRVTRNRQLPGKSVSIQGFSNYDVNVLVARSFDPRVSIRAQFVPFSVGMSMGNELSLPWWTLRISGFGLVSQLYIASSASVDFDDIVLTRNEPPGPNLDAPPTPPSAQP
jgi:hypothetical protein